MTTDRRMSVDRATLRELLAAASSTPWRWSGNTDYEDVRLAAANGSEVFAVIDRDHTPDDPLSRAHTEYLRCIKVQIGGEFRRLTDEEIAEAVRVSMVDDQDGDGEEVPLTYKALAFYVPGFFYQHARDHAVYQVARIRELPDDTPRSDERIYRADVCDVRNPNAQLIRDGINALPGLLNELDEAERRRDEALTIAADAVKALERIQRHDQSTRAEVYTADAAGVDQCEECYSVEIAVSALADLRQRLHGETTEATTDHSANAELHVAGGQP